MFSGKKFDKKHGTKLTILFGPMKSEKTTAAIRYARKYGKYYNVIVINPIIDIRTSNGLSKSRNGIQIDCINVRRLKDLPDEERFITADIVIIDECQFFDDLKDFVVKWLHIKNFILTGLDGASDQTKFGELWDLIPYATKVKKLCSLCEICADGTKAVATIINPVYLKEKSDKIHVVDGDSDYYLPVCFSHSQIASKK